MAPKLKSARDVELMRKAGALVARVLDRLGELCRPGATTGDSLNYYRIPILFTNSKSFFNIIYNTITTRNSWNTRCLHGVFCNTLIAEFMDHFRCWSDKSYAGSCAFFGKFCIL